MRITQCNKRDNKMGNEAYLRDTLKSHMQTATSRIFKESQHHLIPKIINSASLKSLQGQSIKSMTIEVDARTNKMTLHTHNDKGELIETIDTSMPPKVI